MLRNGKGAENLLKHYVLAFWNASVYKLPGAEGGGQV